MSKYSRPDYVRIVGKSFEVHYVEPEAIEGCLGMCTPAEQLIEIDKTQGTAEELDTFIHESLHAIVRGMRIDFASQEAEEAVVDRMAAGLAALFLDNPHVVPYINRLVKVSNDG